TAIQQGTDILTKNDVPRVHDLRAELTARQQTFTAPQTQDELRQLEAYFRFNPFDPYDGQQQGEIVRLNRDRQALEDKLVPLLAYYVLYVLPICLGDTLLATGNYAGALQQYQLTTAAVLGIATGKEQEGYRPPMPPYDLYQ